MSVMWHVVYFFSSLPVSVASLASSFSPVDLDVMLLQSSTRFGFTRRQREGKRIKEIEEEELYFYCFWCLSHSCLPQRTCAAFDFLFLYSIMAWHGDVMVLMYSWSRVESRSDITFSCLLHFFQDNNIISASETKLWMGDPTGNRHLPMTKESKKQ